MRELDKTICAAQLIMEVISQLEGACALLVTSCHYPEELVACKRGTRGELLPCMPGSSPNHGGADTPANHL